MHCVLINSILSFLYPVSSHIQYPLKIYINKNVCQDNKNNNPSPPQILILCVSHLPDFTSGFSSKLRVIKAQKRIIVEQTLNLQFINMARAVSGNPSDKLEQSGNLTFVHVLVAPLKDIFNIHFLCRVDHNHSSNLLLALKKKKFTKNFKA